MNSEIAGEFKLYEWFNHYLSESIPKDLPHNGLEKFILPDGSLTANGAHNFCYRKRLPKHFIIALAGLSDSSKPNITPETLGWLIKCRLINADHEITQLGIVKLAESYPLAKQADFLALPMTVVKTPKDPALSTERNAIKHLEKLYVDHLILHDEGQMVGTVFYACILAKHKELVPYSNMANFSLLGDQKYLIGLDKWSFDCDSIEHVCNEIMRMDAATFCKGFDLATFLHNEAGQDLKSRSLHYGTDFYLQIFNNFGPELLCDLLRILTSHPFLSFPDLTIIGASGISFIEIKVKDKLSFNQIYTFLLLKDLKKKHDRIVDLELVRMVFETYTP